MAIVRELAEMATECVKNPDQESIWSPELGKYVCPDVEEWEMLPRGNQPLVLQSDVQRPSLSRDFKLIFVTSVTLTLLFLVLCVVLTLAAGNEPPPLYEKVVNGLFDLVMIGAGTFLGLLGGKKL